MSLFFKILVVRISLFFSLKSPLSFQYLNKDFFNRGGCQIKFNKSITTPVKHPVSGKVLYYKPYYRSLTFFISQDCMFIDHWEGDKLRTHHSKDILKFGAMNTFQKLRYMSVFFAQFVKVMELRKNYENNTESLEAVIKSHV